MSSPSSRSSVGRKFSFGLSRKEPTTPTSPLSSAGTNTARPNSARQISLSIVSPRKQNDSRRLADANDSNEPLPRFGASAVGCPFIIWPSVDRSYKQNAALNLLEKMWEARQLGKTDFQIKCGGRLWGVHKEVLAANSKYFEETFSAPQEEGTYVSMLELNAKAPDHARRSDCYDPEHIEEVIHFFYNCDFSKRVKEMAEYERLLLVVQVHRTATQFRATEAAKAMTKIVGELLPKFNMIKEQVSGPALADLAQVCRWVFTQPDFSDLDWELKVFFSKYLQHDVECFLKSAAMCEMLNDCIFKSPRK